MVFYYIIISSFSYTMLDLLYNFFTLPYEILKRSFINIGTKFLIFNRFFIKNLIYFLYNESYKSTYELIDKQIIEYTGPFGVVRFL